MRETLKLGVLPMSTRTIGLNRELEYLSDSAETHLPAITTTGRPPDEAKVEGDALILAD